MSSLRNRIRKLFMVAPGEAGDQDQRGQWSATGAGERRGEPSDEMVEPGQAISFLSIVVAITLDGSEL